MTDRGRRRLAWALWVVTILAYLVEVALLFANADLPESPKRHKKEQAKEGHADAPIYKDEQEGTGLVIQHGDEVDVRYVLSVQNQDGTYTIKREVITLVSRDFFESLPFYRGA